MRRTTLTKSKAIVLSIATSFITLALLMVFLGGLGVMAPNTAQADVSADVVGKGPADGATDVDVTTDVTMTFSVSVTNMSSETFMLEGPGGEVTGTITPTTTAKMFTFCPDEERAYNTLYTATLDGSLEDTEGVTLTSDYTWHFTTTQEALEVVSRGPAKNAEDVDVTAKVTATFNFSVTNVTSQTFMLEGPDGEVTSTIKPTTTAKMFTLCPDEELDYNTMYTVTLDESLKETKGLTLGKDCVWNFTTEGPELAIKKTVVPTTGVELEDVVTYTIEIANEGTITATNVTITDRLPANVTFGGYGDQGSAKMPVGDVITWTSSLIGAEDAYTFVFTATATVTETGTTLPPQVRNTAHFNSDNAGSGCDDAIFETAEEYYIYLPLVVRNFGG